MLNGVVVGSQMASGDHAKDAAAEQAILKEKGLLQETSRNDLMYCQANGFAEVAFNIYNNGLKESASKGGGTAPFLVNATFSIELSAKTIHDAYGNKDRGYHLISLYKGMP